MNKKSVPKHLSEIAKNYYREPREPITEISVPTREDAAALRAVVHPEWAAACDAISHPYELQATETGGITGLWISTPAQSVDNAVLLFLHGGAYVLGSPEANAATAISCAHASGMKAFSADYRLAPEHPFPAAVDDAVSAFQGLVAAGYSPSRIGVVGESAGGGLALAMALRLRAAKKPLPGGLVLLSPWVDLEGTGDTVTTLASVDPDFSEPNALYCCVSPYVGSHSPADPLISPVNADLHDFPPMLIQVGGREILLSDSIRLARNARTAGVDVTLDVWEGMWHVFNAYADVPETQQANSEIGGFFRRTLQ